jgi:aryl-alcohol dehydrogenase-like predicted oxidoreductase
MAMALEKRPFGQTGEEVTVIGLGGAGLYKHSFAEGVATVHRALELGVNYLDTAPHYCRGMSQPIFGDALRDRPEDYLFAAKIGMLPSSPRFRSYDALRAQLDENLRLLRRENVDVLQAHDVDAHRWWTDTPPENKRAPLEADYDIAGAPGIRVLREAKEEGLCRFTGVTGGQFAGVARVFSDVDVDACLPAFHYDILRRGARREVIPLVRSRNAAVILGGIFRLLPIFADITNWLSSPPEGTTREFVDRIKHLYAVHRDSGLPVVELTIRYLVADRDVSTI